jgi:putative FmdB family regulatory protein
MPTYEYKCDACGYAFERFQSITADPIKRCPECGKAKVKRLIGTGAGLIFKGSGFYITDYRDKSYTDKAKAESGTSTETKSDAKPAEGAAAATKTPASSDAKPAAAKSEPATPKPESASKSAAKPSSRGGKPKK